MEEQIEHRLPVTVSSEEQAIIDGLLANPHCPSWRAHCYQLGSLWFNRDGSNEELARLGLYLAGPLDRDPAALVAELLQGFASAREDRHTRPHIEGWLKRVAELDGLHRIISAANSTVTLDASLSTVVDTVADVMSSDVCSIFLWERDLSQLCLRATHGLNRGAIGEVNIELGHGITGLAAQQGKPIAVSNVREDGRVMIDWRLNERAYQSILCVPIILFARERPNVVGDRLEGVICVQTVGPRTWHEEEIHFLEVVAGELAFFIANAQRYQETDERLHQKIRELTTLQKVSSAIATTLDLQTVLDLIVNQAVVLSNVDRADIFQCGEAESDLKLLASCGGQWDERLRRPILRAIADAHPLAVVNAYDDVRFPELSTLAHSAGYHSLFCIPLRSGARIMGAIALYTFQQRYFDYEQVQLLSTFADEAAIAIENARLYREAQRSLRVKSTLLQEMHHRVRNNLQTISALLQMQLRRLDPESGGAAALARSAGRIQAIAGVHNLLCREDVGVTTINEVVRQVVDGIQSGLIDECPVRIEVLGEPIPISSREATVVALVINELIENGLSHGLSAEGGLVQIECRLERDDAVIEVRDDGPIHPQVPAKPASGLGLQIIETLVSTDLNGTFCFTKDDRWARAQITFPHTSPLSSVAEENLVL